MSLWALAVAVCGEVKRAIVNDLVMPWVGSAAMKTAEAIQTEIEALVSEEQEDALDDSVCLLFHIVLASTILCLCRLDYLVYRQG